MPPQSLRPGHARRQDDSFGDADPIVAFGTSCSARIWYGVSVRTDVMPNGGMVGRPEFRFYVQRAAAANDHQASSMVC